MVVLRGIIRSGGGSMQFDFDLTITTDTVIALTALLLSLVDLYLHLHKESVRFRIVQDTSTPAYSFSFVHFQRYDCVFFRVRIESLSTTGATISRFELRDASGLSVFAAPYDIPDHFNPNGLSLFERKDSSRGEQYNLRSENLLNHTRFEPRDAVSGYLVFFNVPAFPEDSHEYTLYTYAGRKCYRTRLVATRLPADLKPLHE